MSSANRLDENKEVQKEFEIPKKEALSQFAKATIFLKKNWLVLLILLLTIASYFGLTAIKNSLNPENGNQTNFKSGTTPDLVKQNREREEAQKKNDRLTVAEQAINQANETNQMIKDTAHYVQYSMSNAYKKILTVEVQKVTITKQDTVKKAEKTALIAGKSKQNQQVFVVKSKREKIKNNVITNENQAEIDGFNTVIFSPKNTDKPKFSKDNVPQKQFVKAAIYGNQTVRSGSPIRIRLLEKLVIDGQEIPANSLCSGIAILGANRVAIALTSVQVHGQQISIKSMVYDKDLLPGIAFSNENAVRQGIRQQQNSGIDQASNHVINAIPPIGGVAGAALSTGAGIVSGISNNIRYGGVQKHIGEITLEEGYKVFIQQ